MKSIPYNIPVAILSLLLYVAFLRQILKTVCLIIAILYIISEGNYLGLADLLVEG